MTDLGTSPLGTPCRHVHVNLLPLYRLVSCTSGSLLCQVETYPKEQGEDEAQGHACQKHCPNIAHRAGNLCHDPYPDIVGKRLKGGIAGASYNFLNGGSRCAGKDGPDFVNGDVLVDGACNCQEEDNPNVLCCVLSENAKSLAES